VRSALLVCILGLPLASALVACDDPIGQQPVMLLQDTVTLVVPSPDADRASAMDMVRDQAPGLLRFPERPEHAALWDFALRAVDGTLVLRTQNPGPGRPRPGFAETGEAFEAMTVAPTGSARYTSDPITLVEGDRYYLRSRQYFTAFGTACVKLGKMHVLTVDVAAGTAELAVAVNDACWDDRLAPS
jgi:hypothetical protein